MLKEERQAYIIHQINIHNKVLSSDLSAQLNVSEDTIRRDLNELAESGKVLKVYGGALSRSFQYPFQEGNVYAKEAKKEIVRLESNVKLGKKIMSGRDVNEKKICGSYGCNRSVLDQSYSLWC